MPQGAPQIPPMLENTTKTNGFSMILEGPKGAQRAPEGHPEVLKAASGAPMRALEALQRPPRDLLETSQRYLETVKALRGTPGRVLPGFNCEKVPITKMLLKPKK